MKRVCRGSVKRCVVKVMMQFVVKDLLGDGAKHCPNRVTELALIRGPSCTQVTRAQRHKAEVW